MDVLKLLERKLKSKNIFIRKDAYNKAFAGLLGIIMSFGTVLSPNISAKDITSEKLDIVKEFLIKNKSPILTGLITGIMSLSVGVGITSLIVCKLKNSKFDKMIKTLSEKDTITLNGKMYKEIIDEIDFNVIDNYKIEDIKYGKMIKDLNNKNCISLSEKIYRKIIKKVNCDSIDDNKLKEEIKILKSWNNKLEKLLVDPVRSLEDIKYILSESARDLAINRKEFLKELSVFSNLIAEICDKSDVKIIESINIEPIEHPAISDKEFFNRINLLLNAIFNRANQDSIKGFVLPQINKNSDFNKLLYAYKNVCNNYIEIMSICQKTRTLYSIYGRFDTCTELWNSALNNFEKAYTILNELYNKIKEEKVHITEIDEVERIKFVCDWQRQNIIQEHDFIKQCENDIERRFKVD